MAGTDVTTIDYGYDGLSRLLTANYSVGADYTYGYDVAGNLVNNNGVTRTYNAANQMVNDGTNTLSYDANGNLTSDGVNSFAWDRANRMLTAPGSTSYKYDGLGNRIQQTVSSVVTDYLNDVQPGLVKLLRQDDGTNVDHFVHALRGIHSVDDGTDWTWYAQDGLGSVRGLVDASADVVSSQAYSPIGVPDGIYGAGFGFTGEQTDANDLLYLRARYYAPEMGVFTALDPFEGMYNRPMSLNGYSWVEGNVPNAVDPTGKQCASFDSLHSGSIRRFECERVKNVLERGQLPHFDALGACYYCAMDTSVYLEHLTPEEAVESYRQGLFAAAGDGFIQLDQVDSLLARFEAQIPSYEARFQLPYDTDDGGLAGRIAETFLALEALVANVGRIDGYIEGINFSGGVTNLISMQGGYEVVYNLKTFQRLNFNYGGGGVTFGTHGGGVSASPYIGHVQGFRPSPRSLLANPNHIDNYSMFRFQYSGDFISGSASVSSLYRTAGLTPFRSPLGTPDEYVVWGNTLSIGYGIGGPGFSVGIATTNYVPLLETRKSYIDTTGLVNMGQLAADIWAGITPALSALIVLPTAALTTLFFARSWAASSAINLALEYNDRQIISNFCGDGDIAT